MTPWEWRELSQLVERLATYVREQNQAKGFRGTFGTAEGDYVQAGLIASEAHELMEEHRKPGAPDELEELADVFIRTMDYTAGRGFERELISAVKIKMHRNSRRPVRHGKLF